MKLFNQLIVLLVCLATGFLGGCEQGMVSDPTMAEAIDAPEVSNAPEGGKDITNAAVGEWVSLFDGKTLGDWKTTNFGGHGEAEVKDGEIVINMGELGSGITYTGKTVPRSNYEVELSARRIQGGDFFCGLTFPVKKSYCSLVVGGWGGATVGLSSIQFQDASDNETTQFLEFENKKPYKIRVRVTDAKIEVWMEGEQIIDLELGDKDIDIRPEVEASKPLGIATWMTTAGIKDLRIRKLK